MVRDRCLPTGLGGMYRHLQRDGGELVRGEHGGRRRAAAGGAGLGVPERRRLQRHPARRDVLPAGHQGRPRLVRLQQLLPAQGPRRRDLRLRRRRLRRLPGAK